MALITIVDAVASSTESGTDAVNVFDGEYSSLGGEGREERWASDYSDPQWIYVDLGDIYDLTEIRIWWEGAYSSDYDLEVSDDAANNLPASDGGSAWTAHSTGHNAGGAGQEDHDLTGSSGRYVRVYSHARGTAFGNSIWEIEVYGDAAGGALSGQSASIATAHGTPVASTTAPVTGQALSITLAHGTTAPQVAPAVDGQALSVTVAHGTVAPAVAVAVDGQELSITAEHGSVTVPDSALEGRELSITVAHGTLAPATAVAATGQALSITAAHGTAAPQVNAPVTGQTLSVSVAHGTVSPDVSKVVTGRALTITATHGNVSVSGPVVGQALSITVAHGSPAPAVARAATGQSLTITTAHGSVTVSILAPVQFGKPRLRSVVEFGKPRTRSIIEFGKPRTRPAAGVLSPLQLPGALLWYNADVVTTSGADITAWPNLITDVSATAGGTIAPEIEVVNGRNWVRCYGDGSTVDVGSWFTATEAAVLAAFRHVNSQANFYLAITYQALANADGENVLFAASQGAANLHISRLAVNTNFTNRRATFLAGSGAGVQGLWRDVTPIDYDVHVIEILSTPDSYREIRVDGELTEAPGYAYTTGDQNAFDVFVIGSEVRNSVYNAPANARLRDVIAASDTTAAQRQSIRQFAAARAGISL